jgi:peroxiredoxin
VAKYRDRNVVLLAVNSQETPEAIHAMLSRLQLKVAVGLDRNGVVAEKYAAVAIPQTVIIDADGKIARLFVGGGPQYVDQLCAALEAVLTPATGQGKSP